MAHSCSLLVLMYNQQAYVAKAVAAALAQDCPALEIIISDDASSDHTFDIAQQIVADYTGPHSVILQRNDQNMGVIAHTNAIVAKAKGDILIPAYGDDISYPDRVARIMACFGATDALLVHSRAKAIDADGMECDSFYDKADFFRTLDPLDVATSLFHYLGAAGGWHRALFDTYGPIPSPLVYDDHILGFRAALEGRVALIESPLLSYRDGVGLSHTKRSQPSRQANRTQRQKLLRQAQAVFSCRAQDAARFGLERSDPVMLKLQTALDKTNARLAYYDGGMAHALRATPKAALTGWASEALRDLRKR